MGFHEDDRIRAKNRVHNAAYEQYVKLTQLNLKPNDIVDYCNERIKHSTDFTRNEIYLTVLKIVGRSSNVEVDG